MSDQPTRPSRLNPWSRKKDEAQDQQRSGQNRQPATPGGGMDPRQRNVTIAWVVGGLLVFALIQSLVGGDSQSIEFSRFLDLADDGRVVEVNISETSVSGVFESDNADGGRQEFSTTLPVNYESNALVDDLRANDVEVTATQPSPWFGLLSFFLP
ncbi:MAG: ATP-dependent metallopeptidase FtsH/Yme1/Tma family protein, partial [Actinomycetota bacterium]